MKFEIKIPYHLKGYFEKKIREYESRIEDYDLSFGERKNSEDAARSYKRRLRKLIRQHT